MFLHALIFTAIKPLNGLPVKMVKMPHQICGGREKVGKSNNFKNELTMFTP
jgi:hypothetical protein